MCFLNPKAKQKSSRSKNDSERGRCPIVRGPSGAVCIQLICAYSSSHVRIIVQFWWDFTRLKPLNISIKICLKQNFKLSFYYYSIIFHFKYYSIDCENKHVSVYFNWIVSLNWKRRSENVYVLFYLNVLYPGNRSLFAYTTLVCS